MKHSSNQTNLNIVNSSNHIQKLDILKEMNKKIRLTDCVKYYQGRNKCQKIFMANKNFKITWLITEIHEKVFQEGELSNYFRKLIFQKFGAPEL